MSKEKILVTGGAGFIGSNTVHLLCDEGYEVTVFDNLSMGYRNFVDERAKFIPGDLLNMKAITQALKGIDTVFHFAATSIIEHTIKDPVACFYNNLDGIITLLEAMRVNGVKQIVNSSSASVYGEPESIPVKEDSRKSPMQPYGASKLAVEAILSGYFHSFGINSTSLRYFNAYGPYDEQQPVTRAVPRWIKAIIKGESISLYWKGKQFRDYIFVKDIARAHLAVMKLKGFNYFNIGTGNGILMSDLLQTIFKTVGKEAPIIDLGERLGDPERLVADTEKIKTEVGWVPQYSLEEGIKATVEYYQNARKS